jgi:hypothetical protein
MTETAGEVVQDILQELVVQGAEADLVADETSTAIRYLNRYMTMLAGMGINLGYTKVSTLNDTITIADGAIMGMVKNVAMMLAPQFDVPISMDLREQAIEGLKAMRKLGMDLQPTQMPGTLPIGSGNEWEGHNFGHFYINDSEEAILDEISQNILLESAVDGN